MNLISIPLTALQPEKPLFIFFLDIDGVVFSSSERHQANNNPLSISLHNANLLKGYLKKKDSNSFSNNYWSVILAHHFNRQALSHLMELIRKVEVVAIPQIVIHSRWRQKVELDVIRTLFFGMHGFSRYIVDKTADDFNPYTSYNMAFKGDEIKCWLEQHPNIEHYVIFDDDDERCSFYFKKRFVHVNDRKLLTREDCKRALKANPLTVALSYLEPTYEEKIQPKDDLLAAYRETIMMSYFVPEEPSHEDEWVEIEVLED